MFTRRGTAVVLEAAIVHGYANGSLQSDASHNNTHSLPVQ